MLRRVIKNRKGFTLIEVVIVMAIIAILALLIIGAITIARRTAKESANRANARTVRGCLEERYKKFKRYCIPVYNPAYTGSEKLFCDSQLLNWNSSYKYGFGGDHGVVANLEAEGIECKLGDGATETSDPSDWQYPNGGGGVRLSEQSYFIDISNADGDTTPMETWTGP